MPPAAPRVLIAPDKFKGSASAGQVAESLALGIRRAAPGARLTLLPVADGGDGTVDAALAAGFSRREASVAGPVGDPVRAAFALRGETAVIEMAEAGGLRRLPEGRLRPLDAGTRGTGELIRAALDAGATRIVLGVGGSASTDGGAGMLAALGARLLSADGRDLPGGGAALNRLAAADLTALDPRLAAVRIVLASDVDNPLLGEHGAAAVYGPQKGATRQDVATLEAGLARFVDVLSRTLGPAAPRAARSPGAGAAGGTGFAALAVLGATRESGIEVLLDVLGFDRALDGADLVVTGEGCLDRQTLHGKAPAGVAAAARRRGVPVAAVCGRLDLSAGQVAEAGFIGAYPLADLEPDPQRSMTQVGPLLERVGERLAADLLPRG
ncbi:glycerate kinase [Actinocrinis puniceicyclus]|uniref:Glycerate kinase n=1 Tax=Actinocrinis puniceicyclus TaxID=977794 RepID=A0A8J8BGF3_9ACTN|nr:glycerate kinase [Actinocrinis puniceicyclus]MBS2965709.1 glycerate kinase [Actinocrinis puniceicyclus]